VSLGVVVHHAAEQLVGGPGNWVVVTTQKTCVSGRMGHTTLTPLLSWGVLGTAVALFGILTYMFGRYTPL